MRRMPWVSFLWPGLPRLWSEGIWSALLMAVIAAAGLNLALLSTLIWSELLPGTVRTVLWMGLGVTWVVAALWDGCRYRWQRSRRESALAGATFEEALAQYLKGNWFEAECLLARLIEQDPRDLDARLVLASLLRHTGRLEEAAAQLEVLSRLEGAEKWELEVGRERQLLAAARSQRNTEPEGQTGQQATTTNETTTAKGLMQAA